MSREINICMYRVPPIMPATPISEKLFYVVTKMINVMTSNELMQTMPVTSINTTSTSEEILSRLSFSQMIEIYNRIDPYIEEYYY